MLHEGLLKSSLLERQSGLAETLLEIHPVAAGDIVLVIRIRGATPCRSSWRPSPARAAPR